MKYINENEITMLDNHVETLLYLSEINYHGVGVKKNIIRAIDLLHKAKRLGSIDALYKIAKHHYTNPNFGGDFEIYFQYIKKAAEAGYIDAYYPLFRCYYYGIGTEKNELKAKKWVEKSCKVGCLDSLLDYKNIYGVSYI